jgi:DNA-binding transcriptional ArsR family regulator
VTAYSANEIRAKVRRRRILQLIAENYVLSASLISHTLLLSYATVLRHLRVLNQEGYVELYKEGRILYAKIKENGKEIQIMNSELEQFKNIGVERLVTQDEGKGKYSRHVSPPRNDDY